jgi:hypothetical protein
MEVPALIDCMLPHENAGGWARRAFCAGAAPNAFRGAGFPQQTRDLTGPYWFWLPCTGGGSNVNGSSSVN